MLSVTTLSSNSGPAAFVPFDILVNIFMLLVQDEKSDTVFTNRSAPHNVSRVNRHWRDVALRHKCLWSTFIADLSSFDTTSQHLMRFRCYLERCGSTLPIDIALTASSDDGEYDIDNVSDTTDDEISSVVTFDDNVLGTTGDENTSGDENDTDAKDDGYLTRSDGAEEGNREPAPCFLALAMDRCMGILAPHHARWRDVKLIFPRNRTTSDIMVSYMCSTWPMKLKGLKSLRDLHFDFPNSTEFEHATLDLSDSQLIQRAHISGFVRIHIGSNVSLTNLTHLSLNLFHGTPPSDRWIFRALEQMPNLACLSVVTTDECPLSEYCGSPRVTLAKVKRLEVICKGCRNYLSDARFSYRILCPSLQELLISSTVYEPAECWNCVPVHDTRPRFHPSGIHSVLSTGFMMSVGGTLEKLAINCDYLVDFHLTEALTLCPRLRHLYVANNRWYFDTTIISLLKNECVECTVSYGANNQEQLSDFSSPRNPPRQTFGDDFVALRDFCPNLESIVFEGPSCDCGSGCASVLEEMVDMFAARWDKDGSTLRSFKVRDSEIRGFDEHPTIKRIRSSPRYCSPEWVVNI